MQAARREVGDDDAQALELERGRQQVRERVGRDLGLATSLTRPLRQALSEQMLASPLAVIGLRHEQPVSIFQQLAGGHPSVALRFLNGV